MSWSLNIELLLGCNECKDLLTFQSRAHACWTCVTVRAFVRERNVPPQDAHRIWPILFLIRVRWYWDSPSTIVCIA